MTKVLQLGVESQMTVDMRDDWLHNGSVLLAGPYKMRSRAPSSTSSPCSPLSSTWQVGSEVELTHMALSTEQAI